MTLCRLLLAVWPSLLAVLDLVTACGPVIHCAVAHRATRRLLATQHEYGPSLIPPAYYQLLDVQYLDYTLAGSIFPDYLYHCGGQHAASEVVHWSYYQRAAIQYIHSHYGAEVLESIRTDTYHSQSEQLKQLLAFLIGVVTHSISDISWHGLSTMVDGLPAEYGLIQLNGALDFGCDGTLCEQAHDVADYGTELIIALQRQMQLWLKPHTLQLPIDDILGIYQLLNYTSITATTLQQCHVEFQAMVLGVQRFAPYMYHAATDASPTLQEEWLHSFVGGVDDMTIQSMQGVKRFLWWLDHGVPDELPDKWRPDASAEATASMQPYHQRKAVLYDKLQRLSQPITQSAVWQQYARGEAPFAEVDAWLNNSDMLQLLLVDGSVIAGVEHRFFIGRSQHLTHHHASAMLLPSFGNVQHVQPPADSVANPEQPHTLSGDKHVIDYSTSSYFGMSMTTINFVPDYSVDSPTQTILVISAPASGSIMQGALWPRQLLDPQQAVATGQADYAVAAIDLDCDGIQELVYSQPSVRGQGRYSDPTFIDVVYQINGSVTVLDPSTRQSHQLYPDTMMGSASMNPFGEVLSVMPAASLFGTDELIVGTPHAGDDTEADPPYTSNVIDSGVHDDFDACIPHDPSHTGSTLGRYFYPGWLNFSLYASAAAGGPALKYLDTQRSIFAFSAPTARETECNGVVEIYTFRSPGGPIILCGNGTTNSKLGAALAYNARLDMLAIADINADSATDARWSGSVYLLHNISDVFASIIWGEDDPHPVFTLSNFTGNITTISHSSAGARFGFKLLFAQLRNTSDSTWSLVISAPMYSQSLNHTHGGSVLIYDEPHLLPINTVVDAVAAASYHIVGDKSNAQLGRSLAFSANDTSDSSTRNAVLYIGSPYYTWAEDNHIYDNGGMVHGCLFQPAAPAETEVLRCERLQSALYARAPHYDEITATS